MGEGIKESFEQELDDNEDKETFLRKIFGEDLNLNESGLSFQGFYSIYSCSSNLYSLYYI